jgi:hypothetical protein
VLTWTGEIAAWRRSSGLRSPAPNSSTVRLTTSTVGFGQASLVTIGSLQLELPDVPPDAAVPLHILDATFTRPARIFSAGRDL